MTSEQEQIEELRKTLTWIIDRIGQEEDELIEGRKPNWKKAALESREEAEHSLSVTKAWDEIAKARGTK